LMRLTCSLIWFSPIPTLAWLDRGNLLCRTHCRAHDCVKPDAAPWRTHARLYHPCGEGVMLGCDVSWSGIRPTQRIPATSFFSAYGFSADRSALSAVRVQVPLWWVWGVASQPVFWSPAAMPETVQRMSRVS
jgi:hypothetical protein